VKHHFLRQIDKLKTLILELGEKVERSVADVVTALHNRDADLAARVIAKDTEIDLKEVELEEECLHTMALYQPVARDLRFITALLTINKDLERIGDQAVNIAEQVIYLSDKPAIEELPYPIEQQGCRARSMLRRSLAALVESDVELAQAVRQEDDEVDRAHAETRRQIEAAIQRGTDDPIMLIDILNISHQLERIADHAVNIAEDVIYMATGKILRHTASHRAPIGISQPAADPIPVSAAGKASADPG
jgi:phosphate transport system protein